LKDRLYTGKAGGVKRRAAQTVIHQILVSLTAIMAPIASFLAEEVYSYLPEKSKDSALLLDFPSINKQWTNASIAQDFERLLAIREIASKELEEKRKNKDIGASLEAQLKITAAGQDLQLLEKYKDWLKEFFIVSAVEVSSGSELRVTSERANGEKCPRCWHYDPMTGKNPKVPDVCPKCVEALS
jgi:isoleucyl-tRNA synthetase